MEKIKQTKVKKHHRRHAKVQIKHTRKVSHGRDERIYQSIHSNVGRFYKKMVKNNLTKSQISKVKRYSTKLNKLTMSSKEFSNLVNKKINRFIASNKANKYKHLYHSREGVNYFKEQIKQLHIKITKSKSKSYKHKLMKQIKDIELNKLHRTLLNLAPNLQEKERMEFNFKEQLANFNARINAWKGKQMSFEQAYQYNDTEYNYAKNGTSQGNLEDYLKTHYSDEWAKLEKEGKDVESIMSELTDKALEDGKIKLLQQELDGFGRYGYITDDENEIFSPI